MVYVVPSTAEGSIVKVKVATVLVVVLVSPTPAFAPTENVAGEAIVSVEGHVPPVPTALLKSIGWSPEADSKIGDE